MPDVADLPTSEYEPDTGFSSMVFLMFGVVIVVIGMIIVLRPRKTPQ